MTFATRLTLALLLAAGPLALAAPPDSKSLPLPVAAVAHPQPVDFEREILPALSTSCLACHNKAKPKAGLVLETPADIRKGGENGPAAVAGKGDDSLLFRAAAHAAGVDAPMPPPDNKAAAPNLTPQHLGLLKLWIDQGAAGEVRGTSAPPAWQPIAATFAPIYAVAVSPDGQFAACGRANRIDVYHLPTGTLAARLSDPKLGTSAHRDVVESLAFSPDGTTLASGSYREVKLWRRPSPTERFTLAGPPPRCVGVSPDGALLATGGEDGTIRLYQSADGKAAGDLPGHTGAVVAVQFSPDGSRLASVSLDKTLRVWDVAARKAVARADVPADTRAAAWLSAGKQIATAGGDGLIHLWKLPEGEGAELAAGKVLKGHGGAINALAAVPSSPTQLLSGGVDATVRLWNIDTAQPTRSMNHDGPVTAIAIRPDGRRFASVGSDGTMRLWNADDGSRVAEAKGDATAANRAASAERAKAMAAADVTSRKGTITAAEKQVATAADRAKKAKEAGPPADKDVADKQAAVDALKKASTATTKPVDASAARELAKAEEALKKSQSARSAVAAEVTSAAKAADDADRVLAEARAALKASEERQKQKDADATTAKQAFTASIKPLRAVAFSPDGKLLATAGDDGAIHTFAGDKGTAADVIGRRNGPLSAIALIAPTTLLAAGPANPAAAWDLAGHWSLDRTIGGEGNPPSQSSPSATPAPSPFADRVTSLDFSPDGRWLATGGGVPSRTGEIRLFDATTGTLARSFDDVHSDTVFCVRFSPEGDRLATASADKFVRVIDLTTGKVTRSLEGHAHHALSVAWKRDGRTLASAGADNTLRFWDAATGERGKVVKDFTKEVVGVCFVGEGDQVVAVSGDGKVRMVRDSGADVRAFAGASDFVYAVAATADGAYVIAGGQDGVLRVWDTATGQAAGTFASPEHN